MEDKISTLFEKRVETYKLEKEYESCIKNKRKKQSEELYNFINKRVHPKSRKKLIRMIEDYTDSVTETLFSNNETIYKAGFHDCMELIMDALSF